ncbi:DsbC family protein [Dyella sp.]|uniref:DsbC family protein n=1 Tax=Dyella sp. TaxID=1869338 RepID=UPI002D766CF4|nr:DsbC family protein [Dyella sp.]HET6431718.1 DsbC family protein [Dyella sp.]
MWKKLALALCLGSLTVGVAAAADDGVPPAVEKTLRAAIGNFGPNVRIDSIAPSPLPGFYQVIASGQLVYLSADGKYMMNGDLVDVAARKSLSDGAWAGFRKAQLATVPAAQRIIFAPPHPKTTLTVFTDVNCGFCRQLHEHIDDFTKAGIAVEYLAWPREGVTTTAGRPTPTYTEMVSVWCAADRKASFTAAKEGHAPKPAQCDNPVKQQFELGERLGVNGTPAVFTADGRQLGGYVTAEQVLDDLRKHPAAGG